MTSRPRPVAHFTPRTGWMNDPYGVGWDGTQYHLYYQAIPDSPVWRPDCSWGHAVSDDLARWREGPLALTPQPFETGCWSGCVDADGAYYTRVREPSLDLGEVARARWNGIGLRTGPEDIVLPPPHDVLAFRDPFLVDEQTMIVGASLADGSGAVLRYRRVGPAWEPAGALCSGRLVPDSTREVWECPQLMRMGDDWVLVVSVQADHVGVGVYATVGRLRDGSLDAPRWHALVAGPVGYATSLFRDRDGTACAITWLREATPVADWSGAQSLVSRLTVETGRPALRPLPGLRDHAAFDTPSSLIELTELGERAWWANRTVTRVTRDGDVVATVGRREDYVQIDLAGLPDQRLPVPTDDPCDADVVVDADILEVWCAGRYGAWRLPN